MAIFIQLHFHAFMHGPRSVDVFVHYEERPTFPGLFPLPSRSDVKVLSPLANSSMRNLFAASASLSPTASPQVNGFGGGGGEGSSISQLYKSEATRLDSTPKSSLTPKNSIEPEDESNGKKKQLPGRPIALSKCNSWNESRTYNKTSAQPDSISATSTDNVYLQEFISLLNSTRTYCLMFEEVKLHAFAFFVCFFSHYRYWYDTIQHIQKESEW